MAEYEVQRVYEVREIFPEKGSRRVIQFILRDNTGNSLLAAVGIEKSPGHITYSIAQDFLRVFGSTSTANSQTRWQAKGKVIKWLRSVCAEPQPIFTDPSQKLFETEPSAEYVLSLMARFSKCLTPLAQEGPSNSQSWNSAIVWSGDAWICSKQLKHYNAFCRSGTTISLHSFVIFMSKVGAECLGYVEDLYEDIKGVKLARVRQFYCHKDMENLISNSDIHSNEVFITSNEKAISAASIDGIAAVLTPNHFEKCLTALPRDLSLRSFVCHRQYKKNKIKPFRLTELRGYPTQPILSSLTCHFPLPINNNQHSTEMAQSTRPQEPAVPGFKAPEGGNQSVLLKIKLSSNRPNKTHFVIPESRCHVSFKVNDNIEVLSQDSGLRGCWFRCKILRCSQKFLKVQYYDVLDVDGPGKLEERVPISRLADPDKFGMRCVGRLMIRPWPCDDFSNVKLETGAAVEAWWNGGWWEGVVLGSPISEESKFQVYSPGENIFLTVDRKKIRASKDWINNRWIDIKAKPDIMSLLSSILNPTPKLSAVPISTEAGTSSTLRSDGCMSKSADLKAVEEINLKKRWLLKNNEDEAGSKKMSKKFKLLAL